MKQPKRLLWLTLAALLWSALVLAGYYYVHKPVSPGQAAALARSALDLTLALAITGLAGGLGWKVLPAPDLTPLERLAVQAALGWGLLGLLWLALGAMGLYSFLAGWIVLAAGWVALWRSHWAWLGQLKDVERLWAHTGRLGKTLALGSGLLLAAGLLFALAPPTKWDTLMYQFELPRRYLAAGRLVFVAGNPYWGQPQLANMLYTWAIALRGYETAGALAWCFTAVLLAGVLGATERRAGSTGGWLAPIALLVGFSFRGMLAWGYVDGLAALYGLGVLIALLQGHRSERPTLRAPAGRWPLWAGVLAGLALGVKLTAGLLLPIMLLGLLLQRRQLGPNWLAQAAGAGLIALVIFAPWLLKNALATGNPIYPYFAPTDWMSADRVAYYRGGEAALDGQWLWLPLAATWWGVEATPGYAADIGPLLLLFALPGLLARWRKDNGRMVALWLLIGWAGVALGSAHSHFLQQTRLYFALLPAAALAAGWGWQALEEVVVHQVRLRRVLGAVVLVALGLSLWQDAVSLAQLNPAGVLLGVRPQEQYLDDALGWYSPAMRTVSELPAGSRALFLWEPRGLYAPPHSQADVLIDRWYVDRRAHGDPAAVLQTWQEQGLTHLLLYRVGADFERRNRPEYSPADWQALDELLTQLPIQADLDGVYQLYALGEGP